MRTARGERAGADPPRGQLPHDGPGGGHAGRLRPARAPLRRGRALSRSRPARSSSGRSTSRTGTPRHGCWCRPRRSPFRPHRGVYLIVEAPVRRRRPGGVAALAPPRARARPARGGRGGRRLRLRQQHAPRRRARPGRALRDVGVGSGGSASSPWCTSTTTCAADGDAAGAARAIDGGRRGAVAGQLAGPFRSMVRLRRLARGLIAGPSDRCGRGAAAGASSRPPSWPGRTGAWTAIARRCHDDSFGHVVAEVLAGEREVAGLLGDVDAHDALEERVDARDRCAAPCAARGRSGPRRRARTRRTAPGTAGPSPITRREPSRMSQVRPGVSRPVRFTNSWNISECCASSMTSW